MVTGAGPASDDPATLLFATHYPRLAGWVRRLVDDDETAHELASEAFIRVLSRLTRVDDPRGYLYAAASNLVRDHWRSLERQRRAYARSATRPSTSHPPDTEMRALVEGLPDRLRAPVLLHYYADLPVREVAGLLSKPEGTVKRNLSEARQLLHEALGGER